MIVPPPDCWCRYCATWKLVRMIMSVVSLAAAYEMGRKKGEDDGYAMYALAPYQW